MGRIGRGFRLLGVSWEILMQERGLLVLPLLSFVCIATVVAGFGGLAFAAGLFAEGRALTVAHYASLFLLYMVASFIGIFFNATIVAIAKLRLDGADPTLGDGFRLAIEKIDKILGWALLTASVGMVLRALEERAGWLGTLVIRIVGVAWAAVTFFVVPVLLFEPVGVGDSIRRSKDLFVQRWGEQMVGNGSIGLAMLVLAIPIFVLGGLLATAAAALGIVLTILAFGALFAAGSAMSGIFNAALYRFAVTGEASGGFTEDDFRGAFAPKRKGLLGRP